MGGPAQQSHGSSVFGVFEANPVDPIGEGCRVWSLENGKDFEDLDTSESVKCRRWVFHLSAIFNQVLNICECRYAGGIDSSLCYAFRCAIMIFSHVHLV